MGFSGSTEWVRPFAKIRDITLKVEKKQDRELDKLFADFFRSVNTQAKVIEASDVNLTEAKVLIAPILTESLEFVDDYNEFVLGAMAEHSELGIKTNEFVLTKYSKRLEGVEYLKT